MPKTIKHMINNPNCSNESSDTIVGFPNIIRATKLIK
jgi:hypothetical protein